MTTPRSRKTRRAKRLPTWKPLLVTSDLDRPLKIGDVVRNDEGMVVGKCLGPVEAGSPVSVSFGGTGPTVKVTLTLAERAAKAHEAQKLIDAQEAHAAKLKSVKDLAKEQRAKERFLVKLLGREEGEAAFKSEDRGLYTVAGHLFGLNDSFTSNPLFYLWPKEAGYSRDIFTLADLGDFLEWSKRRAEQKANQSGQTDLSNPLSTPGIAYPWYRRLGEWLFGGEASGDL